MADSKSVVIKLTNEQRDAIKRATGKDISELRVDALEGRFSPTLAEARKAPFDWDAREDARKAPLLDERKAPYLDERKAPLDVGAVDQRKAPLDTGAVDQRKAPLDAGAVDQRKAPMAPDNVE